MQQEALEKGFVTKDGDGKKLKVLKYKQFFYTKSSNQLDSAEQLSFLFVTFLPCR